MPQGEPRPSFAQIERQLRAFDIALSSISDFAYIFDREGRFLYANQPLLDLWGLSLEQAVGKSFYDLKYPDELAAKLHRQITQVFESRQRLSDETIYVSPRGVAGCYEYIFSPVFASDGTVEAVAGVTRDITSRKRSEDLVEAQKRSLEMLVSGKPLTEILEFLTRIVEEHSESQSVAAILLLDAAGQLRIGAAPSLPDEYNNAIDGITARADLGTCSVAAVTGRVVVTPDIEADPNWACIKHLPLGLGLKSAWSRPILARDGHVLGTFGTYFRECRSPTDSERQVVEILSHTAALAIERHLADQERERLLASERGARTEADSANRAKDKFIAVLSHELRTPLSPVVLSVPMLEMDPELPARFRDDLGMIRRNIELEVKLIDDLLDLSRITSGKFRLQLCPVHAHDVLRHAIKIGTSEAGAKPLDIRQELGASNDLLSADAARLEQIFWNLIRNAVKFTGDGGRIVVRTRNEEGRLLVEIEDDGIGISPELLPRIFDAFEQGDAGGSRQFGGLGLGLAIAKAVVEMHHGTIAAASPGPGGGATFTLRFDTVGVPGAAEEGRPIPLAAPAQVCKRARVLLVEDHHDTAWTLARLLQLSGYQVKQAGNAASALELLDSEPFDVVVSDIGLPDASGYHLMQQILQRRQIKGIALSGYGMEDDLRKSREAGFTDHVVKPIDIRHLEAVIDRVIDGR